MAEVFSVTVSGAKELEAEFAAMPAQASVAIRQGLIAAAVLVEGDAKRRVHSDTNPWTGSANPYYKKPTGKLQHSISTGNVEGTGLNQQISIGVAPRGGSFGRSFKTASGKVGSHVNKSDVRVYGPIEEAKHPFLVPALMENAQRIGIVFWQRFSSIVFRKAA